MATQKLEQVRSDRWQRVPWHRSPLLVLRLTSLPSRFSKILPAPGSTCAPCLRQRDPLQSIDVTVLLLSSSSRSGSRNYPTRFVFALRASHRVFHLPSPTILIISPVLSLLDHSINTYVITSRRIRHSILIYIYIYIYRFEYRIGAQDSKFRIHSNEFSSTTREMKRARFSTMDLASILDRSNRPPPQSPFYPIPTSRRLILRRKCYRTIDYSEELGQNLGTGLTFATRVTSGLLFAASPLAD